MLFIIYEEHHDLQLSGHAPINFCTIIISLVPLPDDLRKRLASITVHPTDLLLIWDLDEFPTTSQGGEDYEGFISRHRDVPKCPKAECRCLHDLYRAIGFLNIGLMLNTLWGEFGLPTR